MSRSENIVGFMEEFRREGLRSSLFAAYAALSLLVLFMLFEELSNRFTLHALVIRLVMAVILSIGIVLILKYPRFATNNYSLVVGGVCATIFLGVVLILYHPEIEAVGVGFGSMPAVMFGLFLMYGFLRLPRLLALVIGAGFSSLAVLAAGPEYSGAGKLRLLMYLCAVNVLGYVLSRSIEKRERDLFNQRCLLDVARGDSEMRANSAEKAYSEKLRMISAINHDLRQPITAASAHLTLVRRRIHGGEIGPALQQLDRIDESIVFLGQTLDELLIAAQYESGAEPIRIEYCDVLSVVEQVRLAYANEAERQGLEIRVRAPTGRVEVLSDRTSLFRVLMNLVGNALKFNRGVRERRTGLGVIVRVRLSKGICNVDIADTGIGITQHERERIWEPYVQLKEPSGESRGGLGLGLFVVNSALKRLPNHTIRLRSLAGRGARFSLAAPGRSVLGANNADLVTGSVGQIDLAALAGAYVVVVGSDADLRRQLSDLLFDWGVVSSESATVEELIENEEDSDRVVDALLVIMPPNQTAMALDFIREARNHFGEHIVCAVCMARSLEDEVTFSIEESISFLAIPFAAAALAQIILVGVDKNRIEEQDA